MSHGNRTRLGMRRNAPGSPSRDGGGAPLGGGDSGYVRVHGLRMGFVVFRGRREETVEVLENINLSLDRGEFCCVIGPSGCGKSTLLRICDGLIAPTSGEVIIGDNLTTSPRDDVGFVFQSFNLFPWRTVVENVELGLERRGLRRRERRERALHWVDRVGLDGFESFYPSQISGGMQQRVGLARALAIQPDILLMDEPFGSLDAQTRLVMQGDLTRLWAEERKTVLFVTHDVEEALYLADRVVVISPRPGTIVNEVTVPFARPRHRGDPDFARMKEALSEDLIGASDSGATPSGEGTAHSSSAESPDRGAAE